MKEKQHLKVCRIYQRVSTQEQDLTRQHVLEEQAKAAGYYIAGTYSEKASGTTAERPELQRMIRDLKPGEIVIAEKMDRISRLPLADAEKLVAAIHHKGAKLAIPGVVDLSELVDGSNGVAKIVLESVQSMLLKLALQMAREDWETRRERQRQGIANAKRLPGKYAGRKADTETNERIIELRGNGFSIAMTAKKAGCSTAQVKRIWALHMKETEQAQAAARPAKPRRSAGRQQRSSQPNQHHGPEQSGLSCFWALWASGSRRQLGPFDKPAAPL